MEKTILFAGHDFKFLNNFIEKSKEKFNIIFDKWDGQLNHNQNISFNLLNKADIIFCEWCFGNIIFYSKYKKQHQKLYVRIHRTESYTDCWEKSNLYNIDKIFFVSKSWMTEHTIMKNVTDEKILSKYSYLYNDLSYVFKPQYDKIKIKLEDKNKNKILNIGFIGINPSYIKCPLKCIPILKKLSINYKINFYIIGNMPKDIEWMCQKPPHIFYERFQKGIDIFFKELRMIENINVIKMGYIPNNDLYSIYYKINYVLVPSSIESFHKSALESLMAGCIPLFYGEYVTKFNAVMNWPKELCFNNDNEVIEFIIEFENRNNKYNILKPMIDFYWNKYNLDNVFNSFIKDTKIHYMTKTLNIKNNYCFIHIPKTGGTTIEDIFFNKNGKWSNHSDITKYINHYDKFIFSFTRNPYLRIISVYNYFINGGNQTKKDRDYVNKHISINDFLEKYDENNIPHLKTQYSYLQESPYINYIGKFENLDNDIKTLCNKLNVTYKNKHLRKTSYLNNYIIKPKFIDIINSKYNMDFINYNYNKIKIYKNITYDELLKTV